MLRILLFLMIFIPQIVFSQLSYLEILGNPEMLENEFVGVRDINGRLCGVVQVVSDLEGFSYNSCNGIVKVIEQPGKDLIYLSPDERCLEIYNVGGYEPLKLIFSEVGITLSSNSVWKIKIIGSKRVEQVPIVIVTDPDSAEISVDGIKQKYGETYFLPLGDHKVDIWKSGYNQISENIHVDGIKTLFQYKLVSPSGLDNRIYGQNNRNIDVDKLNKRIIEINKFIQQNKEGRLGGIALCAATIIWTTFDLIANKDKISKKRRGWDIGGLSLCSIGMFGLVSELFEERDLKKEREELNEQIRKILNK